MVTESNLPVGTTGEKLDTTKVTQTDSTPVHREVMVKGDPETLANLERVSPLGISRVNTVIGHAEIADGVDGWSVVHKFGKNDGVGGSPEPLCLGGIYRMPQVANATTLRVKAGNANDTAGGSGAREVTLIGLDETGAEVIEAVPTAGASAGAASTATFIRLYRAYVSASGTYPLAIGTNSQAAAIVIEKGAGSEDWMIIAATMAQSHVGAYTIPLGKTGYLNSWFATDDGNKDYDLMLFVRENILETAASYSGFRNMTHLVGIKDPFVPVFKVPEGPFPALTDIVWAARAGQATTVSIDFESLLKDV